VSNRTQAALLWLGLAPDKAHQNQATDS